MNVFMLKVLACIFMVVDHIKYALPSCLNDFTLYFGRIAFPLFAFCAVQGYKHTKSLKYYLLRILMGALISQIPFMLFNRLPGLGGFGLNVMFTIFFGLLAIKVYEEVNNRFLKYFCVISIGLISLIFRCDYKMYGVILIFILYRFENNKLKQAVVFSILVVCRYLFRIWYYKTGFTEYMIKMCIATIFPVIFMLLYNGKQGPKLKKFYYWFYPIHLLVLYLISQIGRAHV